MPKVPNAIEEIMGHLGAALAQTIPSDDQIIMDHVRKAYEIAGHAYREIKEPGNVGRR